MVMILCTIAGSISAVADESINFDRDVRAILSDKCFYCHGPDQEHREADLRLDRQEDAKNVITAGDPEASEMILRILADDETIMPPADSKKALTEDEINILVRWVKEGAAWTDHWSFMRPEKKKIGRAHV